MNSNFEYYKVFYYVAKYENLTKASSVLKTSQPAVTRTIHNLENELGCRLFTRSKSGMKLTPEGRTFYSYVSAGCAQFFKGENDLSNLISLENGTIFLCIRDNGIGIEDNIKAKIFEPFFTTKPTAEAAGVGLYLCREVILNHQGSIIVKSEKDNFTEFMITIPIYQKSNNNE